MLKELHQLIKELIFKVIRDTNYTDKSLGLPIWSMAVSDFLKELVKLDKNMHVSRLERCFKLLRQCKDLYSKGTKLHT
jgi:hypothetical protein